MRFTIKKSISIVDCIVVIQIVRISSVIIIGRCGGTAAETFKLREIKAHTDAKDTLRKESKER